MENLNTIIQGFNPISGVLFIGFCLALGLFIIKAYQYIKLLIKR